MKQKTITLTYDEVWTLYIEAKASDARFWEKDWEGNPIVDPNDYSDYDKDLLKLYEKLEKKYGWTS